MRFLVGDQYGNMWNGKWGDACEFSASNCRVLLTKKQTKEVIEKLTNEQNPDFEWMLKIWIIQFQEE